MKKLANMCDGCIYSSEYVPTGCLISELAYYTMNEKCECTQKEVKKMEYGKLVNSLAETDMPEKIVTLSDTENLMKSADYKKRFVAEYYQTKIRYEKLKAFNNRIEASRITNLRYLRGEEKRASTVEMPEHDCPDDLLLSQQHTMGEYLHLLEVRAVIEGINLDAYK